MPKKDRRRPKVTSRCLACGKKIQGTPRKRFCDSTCRSRYARAKQTPRNDS